MKTFGTIYFLVSFFLVLGLGDEPSFRKMFLVITNLIISYFVARKFSPHIFHRQ